MLAVLKLKLRLMKDNQSLYLIMMVMSLVLAGVFSNSFGGDYQPTLAIADLDGSVAASDLTVKLADHYDYRIVLVTEAEGNELVSEGNVLAMIVINEDFLNAPEGLEVVRVKESVEMFQLTRILESESQKWVAGQNLVANIETVLENNNVEVSGLEGLVRKAFDDHWKFKKPYSVSSSIYDLPVAWNFVGNLHYLLGMTLFFVTYSILFTVGDLLEDKRIHTMDRLLVSPSSRMDILLANLIPAVVIGMVQITVMVLSGQFLFGVDWGNQIPLVIAIGTLYIFSMTTLSLLIVALVQNASQLGALSPIVLTGMGMIGGCMWPLEIIQSRILLTLSNLTPHKWAMASIQRVVLHGDLGGVALQGILVLALMGVVFFIAGERLLYFKSLRQN